MEKTGKHLNKWKFDKTVEERLQKKEKRKKANLMSKKGSWDWQKKIRPKKCNVEFQKTSKTTRNNVKTKNAF